jgi:hypothetical protein
MGGAMGYDGRVPVIAGAGCGNPLRIGALAPSCDKASFLLLQLPSMAGGVGQPQGWPVPIPGISTPTSSATITVESEVADSNLNRSL